MCIDLSRRKLLKLDKCFIELKVNRIIDCRNRLLEFFMLAKNYI